MTSIPYDPTLVLGNIIDISRIKALQEQKEIVNPVDVAREKMNNLTRQVYKIKMLKQKMLSMIDIIQLGKLVAQEMLSKKAAARAAVSYATIFLQAQDALYRLTHQGETQTKIGVAAESPLDYSRSQPKPHPISYDSIKFDVQYFSNESNNESTDSSTMAESVSKFVSETAGGAGGGSAKMSKSTHDSMASAMTSHDLEGTIVIVAHCNHKNALLIDPFIMDAQKAVRAWNMTFPGDFLKTSPREIAKAALKEETNFTPKLHMLSGCSLASSFVGFVHIHKEEGSDSSQEAAESVAASVKASLSADMQVQGAGGGYGASSSAARTAKSLLSKSRLNNHASLIVRGIIPGINSKKMTTTVATMQPNPEESMRQLAKLKNASDPSTDTVSGDVGAAKTGQQFLEVATSPIEGLVSSLGKLQDESNSVIDTESMFEAFSNYIEKAAVGDAGVPVNFYLKAVSKADVAKCYINEFYPNGFLFANVTSEFGVKPE